MLALLGKTVAHLVSGIKQAIPKLWPAHCALCDSAISEPAFQHRDVCSGCYHDLPHQQLACFRCALPLAQSQMQPNESHYDEHRVCGQCLNKPPLQDHSIAVFRYLFPLPVIISHIKFHRQLQYARILDLCLLTKIQQHYPPHQRPQAVIPIPLHSQRYTQRGYNQSEQLILACCKQLGIPLLTRHCIKTRPTTPQTALDAKQRKHNLNKVFELIKPLSHNGKALTHIAVFDDVMTTGTTVEAMTRVLKNAGCPRVDVWCIARTPKPQ